MPQVPIRVKASIRQSYVRKPGCLQGRCQCFNGLVLEFIADISRRNRQLQGNALGLMWLNRVTLM